MVKYTTAITFLCSSLIASTAANVVRLRRPGPTRREFQLVDDTVQIPIQEGAASINADGSTNSAAVTTMNLPVSAKETDAEEEEDDETFYNKMLTEAILRQNAGVVSQIIKASPQVVHKQDENGWSKMHEAARSGNLDIIELLVETGEADVNARHNGGHTALDYAKEYYSDSDNHEVVVYLQKVVDEDEAYYSQLLSEAIMHENTEVISSVFEKRPEMIHARDENGWTKLHEAVRLGNLDIVKHIVENSNANLHAKHGADEEGDSVLEVAKKLLGSDDHEVVVYLEKAIKDEDDKYYDTLLREAILRQKADLVAKVLDAKPEAVHMRDDNGWSKMHEAVRSGNLEIIKLLAETGEANVNARYEGGDSVLDLAKKHFASDNHEVVVYLQKAAKEDEQLYEHLFSEAIISQNAGAVASIIEKRPEIVHSRDENGWTKLHEAARLGNLDIVQHIVEKGNADILAKHGINEEGDSVLEVAKKHLDSDDHEVVVYLEQAIKDEDDNYYDTLLREAILRQREDLILKVLEAKPEAVHMRDDNGWTKLHEAVRSGNLEATKLLVEKGNADVNARHGQDGEGESVMDVALSYLQSADHEIVRYLTDQGSLTSTGILASEF